jgi:hypothetical protein
MVTCEIDLRQRLIGKTTLCYVLALAEQMAGRHDVNVITRYKKAVAERLDGLRIEQSPKRPISYISPRFVLQGSGVFICDEEGGRSVNIFRLSV